MAIGRGRRREHPNQHFVLLLRKKDRKKVQKKSESVYSGWKKTIINKNNN